MKGGPRLRPTCLLPSRRPLPAVRSRRRIHQTLPIAVGGHFPLELTAPERERDSPDAEELFCLLGETLLPAAAQTRSPERRSSPLFGRWISFG